MAKLVIVESPAKAKTIGKYLGDDYEVTASMGARLRTWDNIPITLQKSTGMRSRPTNCSTCSGMILS